MKRSVLFPLKPERGESLQGFIARTLAWNHIDRLPEVPSLEAEEYADGGAYLQSPGWSHLATLLDVQPGVLRAMACAPSAHAEHLREFLGTKIRTASLVQRSRRVSPAALQLAPFHRAVWMLRPINWCLETWDRLIDQCPVCDRRLGWARPRGIDRCEGCAFDLKQAEVSKAPLETREPLLFLGGLFDNDPAIREAMRRRLVDPFDKLDAGAILDAAGYLGRAACWWRTAGEDAPDGDHRLADGARIILNYPGSVEAIAAEGGGDNALMPPFFKRLRPAGETHYLPGVEAALLHIVNRWEPIRSGVVRLKKTREARAGLTLTAAAQRLRIERSKLRQLVDAGHIRASSARGRRRKLEWFDKEIVAAIEKRLRRRVARRSLAAELSVPDAVVDALLEAGILEPSTDPALDICYSAPSVDVASVERFRSDLAERLNDRLPLPDETPLSATMKAMGDQAFLWVRLFRAVLDGSLDRVSSDGRSLNVGQWHITRECSAQLLSSLSLDPQPITVLDRDLCRTELERLLYHSPGAVSKVVKMGFISVTNDGQFKYSRSDAMAFRARFISWPEIAARCGLRNFYHGPNLKKLGLARGAHGFFERASFEEKLGEVFSLGSSYPRAHWPPYFRELSIYGSRVRHLAAVNQAAPADVSEDDFDWDDS